MVQEEALQALVEKKVSVRVFTMNGYQMRGVIIKADSTMVVLDSEGIHKMIRTPAISTIEPPSTFKL